MKSHIVHIIVSVETPHICPKGPREFRDPVGYPFYFFFYVTKLEYTILRQSSSSRWWWWW